EAQLDRFMLCHRLSYLPPEEEEKVVRRNLALGLQREGASALSRTEFDALGGAPAGGIQDLTEAMEAVHQVHVSPVFLKHAIELVHRTRNHPAIELGCSPRAGIALAQGARARAFLHDRDYAVPEDLFALAEDVVLHRIRLTYEALAEGRSGAKVLQEILERIG
ncbi:MAG TPA: MoxR family ATPase, partial [Planctomycetota bacterium]|nr:MoxR family ATPase [Planctomycetota bacterium]